MPELVHEWGNTFIRFMAGNKVRTPAMVRESAETKRPTKASEMRDFLSSAFG